jgi:hypothetical protein
MKTADSQARHQLRRDQLAVRMAHHGARSTTISAWTGLSSKRIGTLLRQDNDLAPARRPRQPLPRVSFFFGTERIAHHAAAIGSLFELFEVLPQTAVAMPAQSFRALARGEAVCAAYEIYSTIVQTHEIQFEHAILLATELAEGKEICLQGCPNCEAQMLVDLFAVAPDVCPHCRLGAHLPAISCHTTQSPPECLPSSPMQT